MLALCAAVIGIVVSILLLAIHHGPAADVFALTAAATGILACPPPRHRRNRLEPHDEEPPQVPAAGEPVMGALRDLLRTGSSLTGTKRASGWLLDVETGRRFAWRTREATAEALEISIALEQYTPEMMPKWVVAAYSQTRSKTCCLLVDREGRLLRHSQPLGIAALDGRGVHSVLVGVLEFGGHWRGRVIFLDPVLSRGRATTLQGLRQLIQLFEKAHATRRDEPGHSAGKEREEIARDLHDGVTQSLVVAEMDLQLLRREASAGLQTTTEAIAKAQEILRREIRRVRIQIDELRAEGSGHPAKRQLATMVRDFQAETGIETQLLCERSFAQADEHRAHAALQIVREALSNIRKHSGATKVTVQLRADHQIHLMVQDNGRGFDFTGRRTLTELEASGAGPRVVQERVRVNGGSLVVESHPNQGARLEVTLPLWTIVNGTGTGWNRRGLTPKIGVRNAAAAKQLGAA